ncbi:hypothetical protein AGABI1DRAFT_125787 [Agaricus bisporus var. burnettii JB137-S8]|uniref:Uncharacterized protein n=1 Tax=Agaricus bisporus var. burnettii (strain JB137-S8 / ATCC MYA-4627 / FGSC 10392) TaxID=597362 RepID=K5XDZ2_AGABU|nr:uncharacterized protein AGABI1DRAFT_125787 [Agaricus bisporus var. burnettii JB137-S8]EKM81397.1 hypothetical protein AGABI1DRAFT_125787 [Agaricus bisporus var. burnettii JB137-S8]
MPPTYALSKTRNGREYAGCADYPRFPQEELERLVSRAVELETAAEDPPPHEGQASSGKKRARSPTPLEIECPDGPAAVDPSPAGVPPPPDVPLKTKPEKRDGSHLRRQKRKRSEMQEGRRDTLHQGPNHWVLRAGRHWPAPALGCTGVPGYGVHGRPLERGGGTAPPSGIIGSTWSQVPWHRLFAFAACD